MKIAIKIILLTGILGYLVFAISTLSRDEDKRLCAGTEIIIIDSVSTDFINTRFIESIIAKAKEPIKDRPIREIDIKHIEGSIQKSPYIDSVICYYTPDNIMCIRVVPRKPILHVIPNVGKGYYMDANGNDMPSDIFLLDLCLATGEISRQYAKDYLLTIAAFMNNNAPWNNEIQQIHVRNEKHIELIPLSGEHTIIIGEPTNIKDKMNRLSAFYKEGLDKAGWNKYSTINLNYADQIICTKRNKK